VTPSEFCEGKPFLSDTGTSRTDGPTDRMLMRVSFLTDLAELTDFDANWHKWSTEQGHKTINFGGQEVKSQGHTRPKIDLEAWRRHHSGAR